MDTLNSKFRKIESPIDIAHAVFRAAESEFDEVIEKNQKRIECLQEPLPLPYWNVKRMLENIDKVTEMNFKEPRFQDFANQNPWDGKSSKKAWAEIAKTRLRDDYLLSIIRNNDDANLFEQLCEIWPEMTPDPTLTKEQRVELAKLQKQADTIIERAEGLIQEFMKLAKQEKNIVIGTQSKWDTRITDQVKYLKGNMSSYYEKYVVKW